MKLTKTEHLAEKQFEQMSGGEQQRVIIAHALAQEPKVLLLGEPTLHLDIKFQLEVLEIIKRLAIEKKLTVILVCHDLNLAVRYCDKMILLDQGRIYAAGIFQEVLTTKNLEEVFDVKSEVYQTASYPFFSFSPVVDSLRKY